MIFFVYDIKEYRDTVRGFYFDLEEKAPGPLVKNTEEIIDEIMKIERDGFNPIQNVEEFYGMYCYLEDGNSSERVVDKLLSNGKL